MSLNTGDVIEGKYRIVRLLGEGGMGAVYEGENTRIHRKVAIKVLHAAVASKADVVKRFENEAQAAGRIGSEHIVEVLDLGNLPDGERFMVMEFLEGQSLGDRIKQRKRLATIECAPIIYQLLEGLAAAHQANIIHRDLKPDNVYLLTSRGGQKDFVKVLDFGVSKFSALDSDMSMTKTGAVMGTPYYMSPEQARGGKIDHRSDLYSVGVVMYQAVTGRLPFNAETFNELVFKIALENPEPAELIVPNLDPAFAQILARSMARDVNARFQTARDFQAVLQDWMMRNMTPADFAAILGGGALVATAQRGLPAVQLPAGMTGPLGMSQPGPLGTSQPGMYQSQPGMGQSHPGMHQSQPGMGQSHPGMHQSNPGMHQSNPNMLGQSNPQQLGASQTGLAVTTPTPKKNGAVIAFAVLGGALLLGGAAGVYKFVLAPSNAAVAGPGETAQPSVTAPPASAPTAALPHRRGHLRSHRRAHRGIEPMVIEEPAATGTTAAVKPTGRIPVKTADGHRQPPPSTEATPPTVKTSTGTGRKVYRPLTAPKARGRSREPPLRAPTSRRQRFAQEDALQHVERRISISGTNPRPRPAAVSIDRPPCTKQPMQDGLVRLVVNEDGHRRRQSALRDAIRQHEQQRGRGRHALGIARRPARSDRQA
ncbi:MAG: protein kinase [Polyangiaceae bacterium]